MISSALLCASVVRITEHQTQPIATISRLATSSDVVHPRHGNHRQYSPVGHDSSAGALSQANSTDWQPSGTTQAAYLDIAERIVRVAVTWLDADGAIIDPVEHEEWGQTSSRFVSSAAGLLAAGRCADLTDRVLQAMDRCCQRLAAGLGQSPDFWLRELMTAYNCLQPLYPERAKLWAAELSSIDPQQINWQVEKPDQPIADLHNWTVYAAAGEAMWQQAGLAPADHEMLWGYGFFDKYMPYQLNHFSPLGMYRDPGDPITYDLTDTFAVCGCLSGWGRCDQRGGAADRSAFTGCWIRDLVTDFL